MKKVLLSAIATLLIGVGIVNAGVNNRKYGSPVSQTGMTAPSYDYAGVSIASITASSANCQLFVGDGVVYGFVASSNTSITDYISFRVSTGIHDSRIDAGGPNDGDYNTSNEFVRVYLSSIPSNVSGVAVLTGKLGTTYEFPAPIRVKQGVAAKASVPTVNTIIYLWHKIEDGLNKKNGDNELP